MIDFATELPMFDESGDNGAPDSPPKLSFTPPPVVLAKPGPRNLMIGLDVGSTTVKAVVVDSSTDVLTLDGESPGGCAHGHVSYSVSVQVFRLADLIHRRVEPRLREVEARRVRVGFDHRTVIGRCVQRDRGAQRREEENEYDRDNENGAPFTVGRRILHAMLLPLCCG